MVVLPVRGSPNRIWLKLGRPHSAACRAARAGNPDVARGPTHVIGRNRPIEQCVLVGAFPVPGRCSGSELPGWQGERSSTVCSSLSFSSALRKVGLNRNSLDFRFLQRPQGCRGGAEADLPGQGRRRRARRTEHLRRRPVGPKIPSNRPVLATPLERGHPVLRLSRRSASDHLYDKRNRVIERQIAESGSRPRPFPHRRERAEASFSRVEPGPKRMENAAARVGHGESAIRDHIRGQVQVGVTKPAFTRKS
jgi:hypothetical protein